jgi:hypothetical protein
LSTEAIATRVARETPEVQAWAQLLRAHSALTRRFSTELLTMHGLTLSGYEVLLHLAHAPDQRRDDRGLPFGLFPHDDAASGGSVTAPRTAARVAATPLR